MKKRCICGQSSIQPLCDGAHTREGWRCGTGGARDVPVVFAASPALVNVAERLAHRFDGVAAHAATDALQAERLVVICDGHGVSELQRQAARITHRRLELVPIDVEPAALSWAFESMTSGERIDGSAPDLWRRIEERISTPAASLQGARRPRIFLSHAVADEALIFPTIRILREQFGLEIFVCADSIPAGTAWRREIDEQLQRCDLFLMLSSTHTNRSVFCAFEAGLAVGRNKPIRVICLDDAGPPAPLQDIQGAQISRLMARSPWLGTHDAILEACLDAARQP